MNCNSSLNLNLSNQPSISPIEQSIILDDLMEDPDILDRADFEIDAERNAPVVNSSFNPNEEQPIGFLIHNKPLLEDTDKLKKVLRETGFNPVIGRNEILLNAKQSTNRMLPATLSNCSCLSPFKKTSQISMSPSQKTRQYEKVKMKIGASSIMVKTSRMNQFKK